MYESLGAGALPGDLTTSSVVPMRLKLVVPLAMWIYGPLEVASQPERSEADLVLFKMAWSR